MNILNPAVLHDLEAGRKLRLNVGSGMRHQAGFYNVDHLPLPGVDIIAKFTGVDTFAYSYSEVIGLFGYLESNPTNKTTLEWI